VTDFDPDEIFQTSTMGALLEGVYEGNVSIRELLRHGDFGLGTFNGLDGEMLVLDGVCYQLRGDGTAAVAALDELTPFAAVTRFRPDRTVDVTAPCDRAALKTLIDDSLDSSRSLWRHWDSGSQYRRVRERIEAIVERKRRDGNRRLRRLHTQHRTRCPAPRRSIRVNSMFDQTPKN
jgi:alpha-acetolactate decarboxylase